MVTNTVMYHTSHSDPTFLLSKTGHEHPQTTRKCTNKQTLLPHPSAHPHLAQCSLWIGSGCWEPRVSRSALIDDNICGSFPVRALNLGWRQSFGYKESRASHVPVCCSWGSSQVLSQCKASQDRGVLPLLGWLVTENVLSAELSTVSHNRFLWLCVLLYTFIFPSYCFYPVVYSLTH